MKLSTYLRPAQLPEHIDPMYAALEAAPKNRIEKFMMDFAEGDDGLTRELNERGYKAILRDLAGITIFCVACISLTVYSEEIYWFLKGVL